MEKKLLINIWAHSHHAKFNISAKDDAVSVEKAILDKLGEKSIKWEYLGSFSSYLIISYIIEFSKFMQGYLALH